MSEDQKPSTTKDKSSEPRLKIRVLKSGTEFDGLRACKGLVTTTSKANAEALEKQGFVKIIGV